MVRPDLLRRVRAQPLRACRTVAWVTAFLWLGGTLAAWWFGPEDTRVPPETAALFSAHLRDILLRPEPRERHLFLLLLALLPLATIVFVQGGTWLTRRAAKSPPREPPHPSRLAVVFDLALAVAPLALLALTWSGASWGALFGAVLFQKLSWPLLGLAAALCLAALAGPANRRRFGRRGNGTLAAVAAVVVAIAIASFRVFDSAVLDLGTRWTIHFEPVIFSVNQIVHGSTALVDVFPQYGLYGEMLAPIFRVLPWSVFTFSLMLAGLLWLSYVALADILSRHLTYRPWYVAALVALMPLIAGVFYLATPGPGWDPYLQYYPLRIVFPALGVWWLARRPRSSLRLAIGGGLISGAAILWNVDAGVPVLGAFIAVAGARAVWGVPRRATDWLALGALPAVAAAVLGAAGVYLRLKSGAWPDVAAALGYQRLFYALGFGMLPLPWPWHPWLLPALTYVAGFVLAVQALAARGQRRLWETVLFLSVLGLGLFAYYQGRSHDAVLIAVVWPAVLIAAILGDRVLRAIRGGFLPRWWLAATTAVAFVFLLLGVRWLEQWPEFVVTARAHWQTDARQSAVPADARFIREHLGGATECLVIAPNQAALLTEAHVRSPGKSTGLIELITRPEFERFLNRLARGERSPVFVADGFSFQHFDEFDPQLREILATRYRSVAVSPHGLRCYALRPETERNGELAPFTLRR